MKHAFASLFASALRVLAALRRDPTANHRHGDKSPASRRESGLGFTQSLIASNELNIHPCDKRAGQ